MHSFYLTENPGVRLKKLPSRATKNTINSPDSGLAFYQVTLQKALSSILIHNQHSLTFVHTCAWKLTQINKEFASKTSFDYIAASTQIITFRHAELLN